MIDDKNLKSLSNSSSNSPDFDPNKAQKGAKNTFNWSIYTVGELIRFRDEIGKQLPPMELEKMNLEQEMLLQLHTIRGVQNEIMDDEEIPPNQKAQVATAVAQSLNKLAEMQIALYSSERFKKIENILIRTLTKLPEDLAMEFLTQYEKAIAKP